MRQRSCEVLFLLTTILGATWFLAIPGDFPAATLDDRALTLVRGGNPGQNYGGTQNCDDYNAGTGLTFLQCEQSGPFPASSTCVLCADTTVTYRASANGDPNVKLVQDKNNPNYDCSGDKFVGTCVGADPFTPGSTADCQLPDMPTGTCTGGFQNLVQQSSQVQF